MMKSCGLHCLSIQFRLRQWNTARNHKSTLIVFSLAMMVDISVGLCLYDPVVKYGLFFIIQISK